MKIFLAVVYVLAVLYTFHQATYCGYGAASCPVGDTATRAYWLKWYAIFGYSFLALLTLPLLALANCPLNSDLSCYLKSIASLYTALRFITSRPLPARAWCKAHF